MGIKGGCNTRMRNTVRTGLSLIRLVQLRVSLNPQLHLAAINCTDFHGKALTMFDYGCRLRKGWCKRTHENRCYGDPVNEFASSGMHSEASLSHI